MDTIIYVYKEKRDIEGYRRRDYDMGDYRLVRVGVSSELWRILRYQESEEQKDGGHVGEEVVLKKHELGERNSEKRYCFFKRKKKLMGLGKKRIQRLAEKRRKQQLLEEETCRQDFVRELLEDPEHSYFVAEEPISFLEGWSFRSYFEEEWVMHMMGYATLNHFLILGKAECIPRLMLHYVRKMKSLKWVLLERQFGEAEQELVEEIYEEYGLAVEVRLLECDADYRRMPPVCKLPTVLVDFCEEDRIPTADVAKGSIWLDMTATEGKRCRLENRSCGISYFSLKKEWKQPQNTPYQLDTNGKNGYNT